MSDKSEKESTREKVIEKTVEIFSQKGYDTANLTDITEALGVTRSPIYYHFKDKYGLYKAAYLRWEDEFISAMKAITIAAIDKGELCRNTDPDLVVGLLFAIYDGLRIGLERPVSGLKSSDITTLIEIQLSGISNYFCNPGDQTA